MDRPNRIFGSAGVPGATLGRRSGAALDLLCFSHLRWHFVMQRPQHLLLRAARERRVFFWEEPVWEEREVRASDHVAAGREVASGRDKSAEYLEIVEENASLWVIRPHLPRGVDADAAQQRLLGELLERFAISRYLCWYYTPMAMGFTGELAPEVTVYDCMDELRNFAGAPPELAEREDALLAQADVVFTGGISLYEAKRTQHSNVHAFPSSIDAAHFAQARGGGMKEPEDQAGIPRPRAGFFGVVDERFDVELLAEVARLRPLTHFVVLGPVVKIDPATLPQAANVHYLGGKSYDVLPAYLAGWDAAMLPFAINEATRFISPTKTPEYLAAGVPVVSTPVRDVVRGYGQPGLVAIAATAEEFAAALDRALEPATASWCAAVEKHLAQNSWDLTSSGMWREIRRVLESRGQERPAAKPAGVGAPFLLNPAWARSSTASLESAGAEGRGRRNAGPQAHTAGHRRGPRPLPRGAAVEPAPGPRLFRLPLHFGPMEPAELPGSRQRPRSSERFDYVIAGAGFAGSVLAERLASQRGMRVLLIDRRDHIGGNAYDHLDADGVLIHRYGPHIFHTNSDDVVRYLSQFTAWRPYEHRVLASVQDKLLPIPINLDTINRLYDLHLDAAGMEQFLATRVSAPETIRSSEDIVVSRVGRELFELFFRNYTRKQWGVEPAALDASVAGRIPVRFNQDDRYFNDSFQAMPAAGYTAMFERMLDHPRITVRTGVDFRDVAQTYRSAKVIYTGPIDEYFDFRYGPLPYRSLEFRHETHDCEVFQPAAVINYPNDHEYTRVTEFKYLTGQTHAKTSIVREFPRAEGDPYYPIPNAENAALYAKYRELARADERAVFCGRLANYKYFNMDQVVAQALITYRKIADEGTVAVAPPIAARSETAPLRSAPQELA